MGNSSGNLRKRELYPWDIECQERLYGRRSQPIYYRRQGHNAATFDASLFTMAQGYARGLGSIRVDTNGTAHLAAVAYSYRFRNSTGLTLSSSPTNMYQQYVGAFTNAWFREVPDRWRTMYLYDYDSTNRYENVNSLNNVWQYAYNHSFASGDLTDGRMSYCTSSSIYCYPEYIYTYHPVSVAYDHATSDRTIFAWVNATRQNGADDREIWISIGTRYGSERTLNQPFKTGIRSSINVAIACGPFGSADGFYDCVIIYSPLSNTTYGLYLRRFFVQGTNDTNYDLEWDSETTSVGWLTGSNATAWYNGGWRLAHTSGTGIQVRESTDSTSWSHSQTLQQPVGAPQAITVGEPGDRTTRLYFTGR